MDIQALLPSYLTFICHNVSRGPNIISETAKHVRIKEKVIFEKIRQSTKESKSDGSNISSNSCQKTWEEVIQSAESCQSI